MKRPWPAPFREDLVRKALQEEPGGRSAGPSYLSAMTPLYISSSDYAALRIYRFLATLLLMLSVTSVGCAQREGGEASDGKRADSLRPEPPPEGAEGSFTTDFSRRTIPYSEVRSGGPGRDGIPSIDGPKFVAAADADQWRAPHDPVVVLTVGGRTRAYPLSILTWHEIVNDSLGGVPVIVTYCPLCNTAIVFDRRLDGTVLEFGTTGRLRRSNLIMYDRQTESWWQQATGEAVAGIHAGRSLTPLPATILSWASFKLAYPGAEVLSEETGHAREYGRNPYVGYDNIESSPFLYDGPEPPASLPPMARVLGVTLNGESVAYPYELLRKRHLIEDPVGGSPIVIFWTPGTASALDAYMIEDGRDVGTAAAFSRELDGRIMNFTFSEGAIVEKGTGSTWSIAGAGSSGERLTPVVSVNHFWFSWHAFYPGTRLWRE